MKSESNNSYFEFLERFELLIGRNPELIANTLSNVFTMRLIGNKAHGDLGEIAISEFVNQFMYDYEAKHVGKDLFRAKSLEEDILVTSRIDKTQTPISLKAYGEGPLQLSTDKRSEMFPLLEGYPEEIKSIYKSPAFSRFRTINVLPLIYREKSMQCNILVFDAPRAESSTARIVKVDVEAGRGRKYPIWQFEDSDGSYICEVRYGGANANALQRGFWTHTKKAIRFFRSVTGGWVHYSHNLNLIDLFSKALNSSRKGHAAALSVINEDLRRLKTGEGEVIV